MRKVVCFLSALTIAALAALPGQSLAPRAQACGSAGAQPKEKTASSRPAPTAPTEDGEESFLLSFVGDCTLGSDARFYGVKHSFIDVIGEDYDYPFRNVVSYFQDDDCTFVNLETVLKDEGSIIKEGGFAFRGPTVYTKILTGSSVEAVTIANNHIRDYGVQGMESTRKALEEAELPYVEQDTYRIITTERGLKIGLYGGFFQVDVKKVEQAVAEMKRQGAELIVMAIHWGIEGYYRPNSEQEQLAHQLIDLGVNIVYGSHPHVLQRVEEYNGGIIYYSLANFSFGGNHFPRDMDTVILRQQVLRQKDGTVVLGTLTPIPACVSSQRPQNDFQPTPYEEGSEDYARVLQKLELEE